MHKGHRTLFKFLFYSYIVDRVQLLLHLHGSRLHTQVYLDILPYTYGKIGLVSLQILQFSR